MNWLLLSMAFLAAVPTRAASTEDSALERLHSEDIAARERACAELAHAPQPGPRVYPALFLVMDRDLSERVRLAAAKALVTFPGNEPIKSVQRFLQTEPGAQTRAALTIALSTEPSRLEDSGVTDLVSLMLFDDPSPEVRRAAALGLASRGDPRALPAVRRAAENDADKSVRDAAKRAIRILSAPRPHRSAPAFKAAEPKPDAVKGKDACPAPWAWCECDGPIKRPPKCLTKKDCRVELDTMIQLGMPCTWSNLPIGASNENQ
jgi:HEAT repeat protein